MPLNEAADETVITPSYGFTVKKEGNRITITVPKRKVAQRIVMVLFGCCGLLIIPLVVLFCVVIGSGIIPYHGGIYGGTIGGLIPVVVIAWLIYFIKKRKSGFSEIVIRIDRQNLTIDNKKFSRDHVSAWRINNFSASAPRTQTILLTQSRMEATAANMGAAVGTMLEAYNFNITFDYGDEPILAVPGLTESGADHLLDAIQDSLIEMS
jgi:hypothetical protein